MNRLEMLVRGKNVRPANIVQQKLSIARSNLDKQKGELIGLQQKRGEESSKSNRNYRRLEYFDDEIILAKKRIDNIPYEIEALERQLIDSRSADVEKKAIYDDFMKETSIKGLEAKSRLLLKKLESALKTNEEILEFHRRRNEVEKNTGRRVAVPNICGGFKSLGIIVDICEGENNGIPRGFTRWSSVEGEDTV